MNWKKEAQRAREAYKSAEDEEPEEEDEHLELPVWAIEGGKQEDVPIIHRHPHGSGDI